MKNLILYTLISLIANCGFVAGISVIFMDRVNIEFHIEKSVLILGISIFLFSIIVIARLLAEILGDSTCKHILRISTGTLIGMLSINIFTVIKSMFNIFKYNDELFSCKFFTIYYKYSKKELLSFIDYYYEEISTITRKLTLKERLKILGDSKTIREVREKVESYCDYEANSWWPKIYNIFENSISYSLEHPWIIAGILTTIGTLAAYPIWQWVKTTYNVQSVAMSVSDVNSSVGNLKRAIDIINNSLDKLAISVKSNGETHKILIKILNDYFELDLTRTEMNTALNETEKMWDMANLLDYRKRLAEIVDPEEVKKLFEETKSNKSFTGSEYILGGTATHSRLLDNNIQNDGK